MLLAVDIGNTNIKFGLYDGETLKRKLSIPTLKELSSDALEKIVVSKIPHPLSSAIVSSVVPEINEAIREFLISTYGVIPFFVENDAHFGLTINYEPLSDAGSDRLVNAFSAVEKYAAPCIVCSFGTAMTIDAIDSQRTLVGGLIAPGMKTLAAAMKITASRLPEVEIEKPSTLLQNNTVGAIQSGIVYGYFGLVEELVKQIKNEVGGNPKVIATGGFATLISKNTTQIDVVDENLLLDGLRMLHERMFHA